MTKAVRITKAGSVYDDLPEERYHFPRQYLGRMEACVGDWIVYYEPGRLIVEAGPRCGRRSYFGTARGGRIEPDSPRPAHFYVFGCGQLELERVLVFRSSMCFSAKQVG